MFALLLAVIYLAFISLGLPDSLLGSAWSVLYQALDVPFSYAGIITMIISASTIVSSLFSERVTRKCGTKYVTLVSVLLTAAALFGFSTANAFWMLCVWAIPYGLGAGAIDAALNNYVALHYTSRHMSWLHCFWGVGTIISPNVMSYSLMHSGWQSGYRTVSLIQFGIALIIACSLPLWKINRDRQTDRQSDAPARALGLINTLRIKGVPYLLTGFMAYCAAESTVSLWASSYLVQARNVPKDQAAAFASFFFIGITAGRFLSGLISNRVGDRWLIRIGVGIAAVGLVCVAVPFPTSLPALIGFIVIGLGFAPIYPAIIHSTPSNFGAENSQAVIGIQMACAYVGSTLMPPLFGLIADHISIRLLPLFLTFFVVLIVLMTERTYRKIANGQRKA